MLTKCADCGNITDEIKDLSEVKDLESRLDPGSEVPAGECLICGALCYLMPRFTVAAGRSILRDGQPMFTVVKSASVEPMEADQLCHILAALLNQLGSKAIETTYLGGEELKLRQREK